jgi:hypothetical protein
MKATMNMNQIVKVSIVAMMMFFASIQAPVQAASRNNSIMNTKEIKAASSRLEKLSLRIENAIKFNAVAEGSSSADLFELEAAEYRLENMALSVEKSLQYTSPAISEITDNSEVSSAFESLAQMTCQIEQLVKYNAASIAE